MRSVRILIFIFVGIILSGCSNNTIEEIEMIPIIYDEIDIKEKIIESEVFYDYSETSKTVEINNSNVKFDLSEKLRVGYAGNETDELLRNFIEDKLMSHEGNVYTNYMETYEMLEHSTGHESLSESLGLIMLYYAMVSDKDNFDKQLALLEQKYLTEDGLLRWRIRGSEELTEVSATIDDLRVVKALMYAHNKWGGLEYITEIEKIEVGLREKVLDNNQFTSYYDPLHNSNPTYIDVIYLDLETIRELGKINEIWDSQYVDNLSIVENAYINDSLPLYETRYFYEKRKYSKKRRVNMTDNMAIILHLAQVEELPPETYEWLKNVFYGSSNQLHSLYNKNNGEKQSNVESTAIYGMMARLAKIYNDYDFYIDVMSRMKDFQIINIESEIYGAYGDENTLMVFSYDCLHALLAY